MADIWVKPGPSAASPGDQEPGSGPGREGAFRGQPWQRTFSSSLGKFPPSCRPFRLLMNSWQLMLFPMFCGTERSGTAGTPTKRKRPASHPGTFSSSPRSFLAPPRPRVPQMLSPPAHLAVQVRVQEHDGARQGVHRICPREVNGEKVLGLDSALPLPTLGRAPPSASGSPQPPRTPTSCHQGTPEQGTPEQAPSAHGTRSPALLPTEEKSPGLQWWKRLENWNRTRSRSWVSPLSTSAWRKLLGGGPDQDRPGLDSRPRARAGSARPPLLPREGPGVTEGPGPGFGHRTGRRTGTPEPQPC